ncbi:MAG: alpha/beta hydrolase [Kiritimatiellia bacterium]
MTGKRPIRRLIPVVAAIFLAAGGASAEKLTYEELIYMDDDFRQECYKEVDGRELNVHIYEPEGHKAGDSRPALMVFHGGGWSAGAAFQTAHFCRYFALRGMVTVNVEYRLALKDNEVRVPQCIEDCRDALAYVRKHASKLGIDPERIAVLGGSAGGHLAASLALSMNPTGKAEEVRPPAAAVLYYPCLDLAALEWMKNHPGTAPLPGSPEGETWEDRAKRVSPINHVKKGLPPILLVHGTEDTCVPIEQSDRFNRLVRKNKNKKITYHRMKGWGHAFIVPNYGTGEQIVEALEKADSFFGKLGYVQGKPVIEAKWRPPAYHSLLSQQEKEKPHVKARSFAFHDYPFLDGQWQGILTDSEGNTWFSISSHSGIHHAQVFRYDAEADRVDHIADLGQVCGEKMLDLADGVPEGKIHSNMFEEGDLIYCSTTDAHRLHDEVYSGGYWLAIHRKTGKIEVLGRTITEDGLLCMGYDYRTKMLYGHTNVKGLLTRFDPATGEEKILGRAWFDSDRKWARGLYLMFPPNGKIYGSRPPRCSFWEYDPGTEKFRTIRPDMPDPEEIKDADEKKEKQWERSGTHLSIWNEQDHCYYMVRSFDEMLMRFYPPKKDDGHGKIELLHRLRPPGLEMRYGNRCASCTLVMHDRTVYYTPSTGWGGVTHLVSYHVDRKEFKHYGPIVVEGYRRVSECHSMDVGEDGRLYLVVFVYSIENVDPVRRYAMRDKYPFHPRFLIIDPSTDCKR